MYRLCFVCVLVLQYLPLEKGGQTEARVEKQATSSESSQIGAIGMQRKRHRSANSSLEMQKGLKKGLLKLLKGHGDLQKPAPKMSRDNLNNFRNDSDFLIGLFKSLKDASEGKIKSRNFNENFNEDQFKAE